MTSRRNSEYPFPTRVPAWTGALLILVSSVLFSRPAAAAPYELKVRIVHASTTGKAVDPKVKDLAEQLAKLSFTSIKLRDEASLKLEKGASGRMQLPNEQWMTVKLLDEAEGSKLRLELEVKKLEFKATVLVGPGATVATRGPDFEGGVLVLAVTRPK